LSEQNFTDSQFLAQDLRQVMLKPHWEQILVGKLLLLPLKEESDFNVFFQKCQLF